MIQDKIALITGGTRGIGRSTALAMVKAGAKVAVTGRTEEEGLATVQAIEAVGGEGLFIQGDVSCEADMARAVADTVSRFGRLDIAFNNAGIGRAGGPLAEATVDDFSAMFDVNVKGIFLAMQYEIREFLAQGDGGAIVNCGSIQGHIAIAGSGHYTATKHAVEGYTKVAALDYAPNNIRVNTVSPGVVSEGRLGAERLPDQIQGLLLAKHPLGRFALGRDVAEAVIFLLSDSAAFITGTSLAVDGGYQTE
jgi:NAD(P)-dependent dehydrogenase (short-subunit alcohol dehydrogenase family)